MKSITLSSRIGFDAIPLKMGNDFRYFVPSRCHGCGCHMMPNQVEMVEITLCPYCDPDHREQWEGLEF